MKYFENVALIKKLTEENKELKEGMIKDRNHKLYNVIDVKGRTLVNYKGFFDKYYNAKKHDMPEEKIGAASHKIVLK